jgi:hypothetical protein
LRQCCVERRAVCEQHRSKLVVSIKQLKRVEGNRHLWWTIRGYVSDVSVRQCACVCWNGNARFTTLTPSEQVDVPDTTTNEYNSGNVDMTFKRSAPPSDSSGCKTAGGRERAVVRLCTLSHHGYQ